MEENLVNEGLDLVEEVACESKNYGKIAGGIYAGLCTIYVTGKLVVKGGKAAFNGAKKLIDNFKAKKAAKASTEETEVVESEVVED